MNNVKDFLLNERGLADTTYKNRYNLIRRTLIKINGNNNDLINDSKVIESQYKNDSIFLNDNEKHEYLILLYKEKDVELILINHLIFTLGFNVNEIGIIKINNFNKDFSLIKIRRNSKIMKRKIETFLSNVFKLFINKNSLLISDYLIYLQ